MLGILDDIKFSWKVPEFFGITREDLRTLAVEFFKESLRKAEVGDVAAAEGVLRHLEAYESVVHLGLTDLGFEGTADDLLRRSIKARARKVLAEPAETTSIDPYWGLASLRRHQPLRDEELLGLELGLVEHCRQQAAWLVAQWRERDFRGRRELAKPLFCFGCLAEGPSWRELGVGLGGPDWEDVKRGGL